MCVEDELSGVSMPKVMNHYDFRSIFNLSILFHNSRILYDSNLMV